VADCPSDPEGGAGADLLSNADNG